MRRGWESEAQNWAKFARTPGHDHSHEEINLPALLELLPPPGPGTLDLACGEGRLSRLLKSLGHQVVGIDAAPTMVQLAATHEHREPVLLADASELPFRDEAFSLVVAYMCLHDIDAMPQAVHEVARVLEPSGQLCAAIPHPINTAGTFQDRDAAAPFVITGSYLDPAPSAMAIDRGGVRLTFHSEHRPLEAYFRALEAAGLLTETIREARPSDRVVGRDPAARRWQRIPLFLHLRARKLTVSLSVLAGARGASRPPLCAARPEVDEPIRIIERHLSTPVTDRQALGLVRAPAQGGSRRRVGT
jgi:SAM-dependent methyltransferase